MELDVGTVVPGGAGDAMSVCFVVMAWQQWHPTAFIGPPPIKGFVQDLGLLFSHGFSGGGLVGPCIQPSGV